MKITIKNNSKLEDLVRSFPKAHDVAMANASIFGMDLIKERTAKGKSAEGKPFKKYSARYGAWKSRRGNAKPNLFLTGKMLGSMSTEVKAGTGRIFFLRKAESKKAMWNDKTRPFFSFSESEKDEIAKEFRTSFLSRI